MNSNASYQDFLNLLLSDVAKAPVILADVETLRVDGNKLLADAGISWSIPTISHSSETLAAEGKVIEAFQNSRGQWECDPNLAPLFDAKHPHAIEPEKFGDGTILKGLGTFFNSPFGQAILQLLLGKLGGGTTKPAIA